jgi:hypothetical protein
MRSLPLATSDTDNPRRRNMSISRSTALFSIIFLPLTLACREKEGPAEQAGEKIDKAVDTMQEKAAETSDKAKEQLEEAGDKVEEATDTDSK